MKVKNDHRSKQPQFKNELFSYTSHHFTPHGRYELNKLTSLPMCGFIAQLVEQRTGNAEVTGSNPVEALIFFRLLLSSCLNWKIYCDDLHFHLQLQFKNELFHICFTLHIIATMCCAKNRRRDLVPCNITLTLLPSSRFKFINIKYSSVLIEHLHCTMHCY